MMKNILTALICLSLIVIPLCFYLKSKQMREESRAIFTATQVKKENERATAPKKRVISDEIEAIKSEILSAPCSGTVPRVIWFINPNSEKKRFVNLLKRSWEVFNPGYRVYAISKDHALGLISRNKITQELPVLKCPKKVFNLIALGVLEDHGGVVIDCNTFCGFHLDKYFLNEKNKKLFVFSETIMACAPGLPFLSSFNNEVLRDKRNLNMIPMNMEILRDLGFTNWSDQYATLDCFKGSFKKIRLNDNNFLEFDRWLSDLQIKNQDFLITFDSLVSCEDKCLNRFKSLLESKI